MINGVDISGALRSPNCNGRGDAENLGRWLAIPGRAIESYLNCLLCGRRLSWSRSPGVGIWTNGCVRVEKCRWRMVWRGRRAPRTQHRADVFENRAFVDKTSAAYDESHKTGGCNSMPRASASRMAVMESNKKNLNRLWICSQRRYLAPTFAKAARNKGQHACCV